MNQSLHPTVPNNKCVHLYGYLRGSNGLGESARLMLVSLLTAGVPVKAHVVPLPSRDEAELPEGVEVQDLTETPPDGSTCIFCLNPEALQTLEKLGLSAALSADKRKIGVWFWEVSSIPESSIAASRYIDELWVASPFLADAFGKVLPIPVRVFPHPFDPSASDSTERLKIPALVDRFVFLFMFGYDSSGPRKNPEAVCEAFVKAFPQAKPDGPVLIIKSVKARSVGFDQHVTMTDRFGSRGDIFFIDGVMSAQGRMSLLRRCDCYLSLHRSEGLGLSLMEAMADGKPTIATGFSGNLSFMSSENSLLVGWESTRKGLDTHPYDQLSNASWAEPNTDEAAAAMRKVFSDRDFGGAIGVRGQQHIRSKHGLHSVGRVLAEMLESEPPGIGMRSGLSTGSVAAKAVVGEGQALTCADKFSPQAAPDSTSHHSEALVFLRATKSALAEVQTIGKNGGRGWFGRNQTDVKPFIDVMGSLMDSINQTLKSVKQKETQMKALIRDLELTNKQQQAEIESIKRHLARVSRAKWGDSDWHRLGLDPRLGALDAK